MLERSNWVEGGIGFSRKMGFLGGRNRVMGGRL